MTDGGLRPRIYDYIIIRNTAPMTKIGVSGHKAEPPFNTIYKKKEADKIANYRPIMVLNTDYKVFMKAIATRLMKVAPSLIHLDQAGFIRGRSIQCP